jgi:hypothetical protein
MYACYMSRMHPLVLHSFMLCLHLVFVDLCMFACSTCIPTHVLHAFMLCLRFVLVDICMRICPNLVHLCALASDTWACVSIGMHAIWQVHPRQRQAAKRRRRPSGNRHGLLFVMMWARPRRNRQLLRGSGRSSGATLAAGRGTSG